jgi:hypothetical protein
MAFTNSDIISERFLLPDKNRKYHLHLVSDATGETLESMSKAALVQFEGIDVKKHSWPMIRTPRQMEKIIFDIKENPGLVMYTLINSEIREVLTKHCKDAGLPSVSLLEPVIDAFGAYFSMKANALPGQQYALDNKYFERIEALQYTMAHDDGQHVEGLMDADIILVGVSRSSKTPTSIYLANRGFKTANVPFVLNCPMPTQLDNIDGPLVVGLTVSPDRLVDIRANRLRSIRDEKNRDYVSPDIIKDEVLACRRYCSQRGWLVLDVTRRSIEESAVAILNLLDKED